MLTTPRVALAFATRVAEGDCGVKHMAAAPASTPEETLERAGAADLGSEADARNRQPEE
jgi:hypothetical protein